MQPGRKHPVFVLALGVLVATATACDGSHWTPYACPDGALPRTVWGTSSNDVWAVGEHDLLLHWNGSFWRNLGGSDTAFRLEGVWGSGPADVWAVGSSGKTYWSWVEASVIRHWDGTKWSVDPSSGSTPNLKSVWGSAADDVWAVGQGGTIVHYDGVRWTTLFSSWTDGVPTPSGWFLLNAVWGSSRDDVWAVGDGVAHWDGNGWTLKVRVDEPSWSTGNSAVWGTGAEDVWVANGTLMQHFDGRAWKTSSTNNAANAIWGSGANDIWGAGAFSTLLRYDGERWSLQNDPPYRLNVHFFGIWGSGPGDVWIVGEDDSAIANGSAKGVLYRFAK